MPPIELRHPLLREQLRCVRCNSIKEKGLVLCWPCFRMWKQAPDQLEGMLDAYECTLGGKDLLARITGRPAMKTINGGPQ